MVNDDKNNTKPVKSERQPDLAERMVDSLSSKTGLRIIFWMIAPIIWIIFAKIISYPMVLLSYLLIRVFGITTATLIQTIVIVTLSMGYAISLVFIIWLWKKYKHSMIENKRS